MYLISCSIAGSATLSAAATGPYTGPLYNQVRAKSSHNSYQRIESIGDQLVYHRVHSLELDIHMTGTAGDFQVFHDSDSTNNRCRTLSGCLRNITAEHDVNPNHEVITIFIDLKEAFTAGHDRATLDAVLAAWLGSLAKKPADLMAECPAATTLQQSVKGTCRWPSLTEMTGRYFVVLTGNIDQYASTAGAAIDPARMAFVAGNWATQSTQSFRIFFNHDGVNAAESLAINSAGFVGRCYNLNDSASFAAAKANAVHFLATDKVNYHQDTWAETHNSNLWPFECITGTCPTAAETAANGISLLVNTEDIDNNADSGFFFREIGPSTGNIDVSGNWSYWEANISQSESHVGAQMTKGCLMARAGRTSTTTPYFAVCTTGDDNQPRIQWRTGTGTGWGTTSYSTEQLGVNSEGMTFFRLRCKSTATTNTTCEGYVSPNNLNWYLIGSAKTFATQLKYQGIAASSHGTGLPRKFYFERLRKQVPGFSWEYLTAASPGFSNVVGTVYSSSLFNGLGTTSQPGPN
ncbi:MAG TPA: hypothetical protein VN634_11040 [Candidatus Limnocylindrales bacterium]|nr:hypothetical protein [Candidatus Limnocylindrales bacterium]